MNKLDLYINMNMKLIMANLLVMGIGDFILCMNAAYWYSAGPIFSLIIYILVLLMEFITMYIALVKVCRTSVFGREAALYQSLPIDKQTFITGKVIVAQMCYMVGLLPIIIFTPLILESYGLAYSLDDFLIIRGNLPDEIWLSRSLTYLTVFIFQLTAGAVTVACSLYFSGMKKTSRLVAVTMTAGAVITAAIAASIPWAAKIINSETWVTPLTPVLSLCITAVIFVGAIRAAYILTERGDMHE